MAHRAPARRSSALSLDDGIPGKVDAVSLRFKANLSFAKWSECGVLLGRIARSSAFWVGDWIAYGEDSYGEKFSGALDQTGYDPKTLLNYSRICRAVAVSRRRESLSFAHHDVVSALDPEDQSFWLQRAEEGDRLPSGEREPWSSRRLRAELKKLGKAAEAPAIDIEVLDKSQVPLDYMVVDKKAVQEAYNAGTHDIPGLKLVPAVPEQGELPE